MKIQLELPALVLNVVSLVASIVGIVIPYWEYASNNNTVAARGLWHRCDTKNQEALDFDCFAPYPIVPNYLHAVRALELLGMILVVLSICCGVLRLLFMKERVLLPRIAGVSAISADCQTKISSYQKRPIVQSLRIITRTELDKMDVVAEKKIGIASLAVSSLSLLFNIIALAIPTWISASYGAGSYSIGLWKSCTEIKNYGSKCADLIPVPGYLAATRAMMILGMLLILAAVVCAVMKLFVRKEQERLPKLAAATAIISGIFMLIGAIVFAVESSGGAALSFGAGFGLAIVSALFAILAGVGYLVAEKQKQI